MDQVTFIQQAGRNQHDHICDSLELFAAEVLPEFKARAADRQAEKDAQLAPYVAAALERKVKLRSLADEDIPTVVSLGRRISEESTSERSVYKRPSAG